MDNQPRILATLLTLFAIAVDLRSSDAADYPAVSDVAGVVATPMARQTGDASSSAPNAWKITAGGGLLAYYTNLTAAQKTAAFAKGWRFTVRSRLVQDSVTFRTMLMALGNGTRRFALWWDLNSGGNLTAQLDGGGTYTLTQGGVGARDYHTHELEYNAATARATYRFDGRVITNWAGQLSTAQNGRVYWGAGVGPGPGQMDFHQVNFEVTGLGLLAGYEAGTQADLPVAPAPLTQGWRRDPAGGRPGAEAPASSVNDRFADRLLLTGATARSYGANVNASAEPGEPAHAGILPGKSLWWSWTAPSTGGAFVTTAGSSFDTALAVYTADSIPKLVNVVSAARSNAADHVTFRATARTTYQIAVDRQNGSGEIALGITLDPAPPNDDFDSARALTGGNLSEVGSTLGATKQPGEPNHVGKAGGRSVWYRWTAPSSGCVALETAGSDFDTLLGVYAGTTLSRLTAIASNDDSGSQFSSGLPFASALQFDAVAGITYRIAVDGYNGAAGEVVLRLTLSGAPPGLSAPANDQFAKRQVLTGTHLSSVGSILAATREPGEPVHGTLPCGKSVWWQWTAPFSGGATLRRHVSESPALLKIYTGTSLATLTAVPVAWSVGEERGIFKAVAGTQYQIVAEGTSGDTIGLGLDLWPSPPNDNFPIPTSPPSTGDVVLAGTNLGATTEPAELRSPFAGPTSGYSVWWKWRALSTGTINIKSDGTDFNHVLEVFAGATLSNLTLVARSEFGQVSFVAKAGQTYYFRVDGLSGAAGAIRLKVEKPAKPANDLFSGRSVISGANIVIKASNIGATRETGEPNHAGIVGGKSVWWQWSTARAGRVFVSTYGSSFDTLLAVYDGPSPARVTSLKARAANDNFRFRSFVQGSFVAFDYVPPLAPLRQLYIAVDGKAGAMGDISLSVTCVPRPTNDNFNARASLNGTYATTSGSVIAATRETGEPLLAGSNVARTVWYSWTAPSNSSISRAAVTLRAAGADFVPDIGVFRGTALTNLMAVPMSHYVSALTRETTFEAMAGATYQIGVGGDPEVDIVGHSFVERVRLGPPGTFTEGGNFSLSLEFATLALSLDNREHFLEPTGDFTTGIRYKLNFSALANIVNYGTATSRSLRIRLVAIPVSPDLAVRDLGVFTPPPPGEVSAGDSVLVSVSGVSAVGIGAGISGGLSSGLRWSVYALLEEYVDTEWFPVSAKLVLVVLPFGIIYNDPGVIIPDPPLRGDDNCRWDLVSIQVVAPGFVVEGSTNTFSYRVIRQDSCSSAQLISTLTRAPWQCSLAGSSFTTNGVLTIPMGIVHANTQSELSFEYEYRGIPNVARTNVLVYNREPRLANARRLLNGNFLATLEGVPMRGYVVEASTNLTRWTGLPPLTTDNSGLRPFTDPTAGGLKQQFYRARER